jgi:Fe-S-cluster containining protein
VGNDDWVTGTIEMRVGDAPLKMEMTVPAKPVKPHRMLPIFQQMTDEFVGISVQAVESEGRRVSCAAGCGACCRQPVPISKLEAYRIAELVEDMPNERRNEIKRRFADAVRHFEEIGWFARMDELATPPASESREDTRHRVSDAVLDYFHEWVACPFLENESCTIHESRPLACREYLVTSSPANCADPVIGSAEPVPLFIKPSDTVKLLGREGLSHTPRLIPLISALAVAEEPDGFVEKTGEAWLADFFGYLTGSKTPGKQNS